MLDPLLRLPLDIHRIRLLLRPKQMVRFAPHQAAMFYAMLCDANARTSNMAPAMPDGVLLDAPDQAIVTAAPNLPLSLGLTVLVNRNSDESLKLNRIVDGLRALGRQPANKQALREFTIERIEDLERRQAVQTAAQSSAVSDETLQRQWYVLKNLASVTLQFTMPLRCSRPKHRRIDGHSFFDETYFPAEIFLNRLRRRLMELGWSPPGSEAIDRESHPSQPDPAMDSMKAQTVRNELIWLDIAYGSMERKTLGGVVGRVTFSHLSSAEKAALILGQYLRIGENTRFGFGAYHLLECGDLAPQCPRTTSLLERACTLARIDVVSEEMQLESGVLSRAVSELQNGQYHPDDAFRVEIPKTSCGFRTLMIPSRRDRAVGRIVLMAITEAMDAFMESSSMAYRRGLGRDHAARKLRALFRSGYQWAVRADFESFFDTVDHQLLRTRLAAYLPDPKLIEYLMSCVVSSSGETQGIPTGSPLSPLLANLFLDRFDEQIANRGGRLVRYSDDFLILCKTREQADELFATARAQAGALRLKLNEAKSATLHLPHGFDFLGFRFHAREEWEWDEATGPQLVEDLGWQNAKQHPSPIATKAWAISEANGKSQPET